MKVCDVVLDSIWYDPRVRRQIAGYTKDGNDLFCVGYQCERYDPEQVKKLLCQTKIIAIDEKYERKQKSLIKKLYREKLRISAIKNAIIEYQPDLIHANDLSALIPAYVAYKKLKCKLVYDSHEINTDNYTSISRNAYRRLLAVFCKHIEKHIVKRTDLMVCVSHAAAEYFEKEYKIRRPLVVTNSALTEDIERAKQVDEKNAGFEVLNHGTFYAGRGYDIMVKAAPFLKDYPEIVLALRGFGKMEEELKSFVAEHQCNNVVFYPKVKVEELIPLAKKSMVGLAITEPICLNFKLSVSNKLFEYAAAGLPVIMSDIPEHRYLNAQYHFGIIIPQNTPEELAKAILELFVNKELYDKLSQNSQKMTQALCWEKEFGKLLRFEKKLMGTANDTEE